MDSEQRIVDAAVEAAPTCPGLEFKSFRPAAVAGRGRSADGSLDVAFCGRVTVFGVQVRTRLYSAALERVIASSGGPGQRPPLLLIADQVSHVHADLLRRAGVAFLDTAGNASLELPGLHLLVVGKRRPSLRASRPAGRLFHRAGLKLVLAFLTDPGLDVGPAEALVAQPLRSIRDRTGVALGTVAIAMAELRERGYLVETQGTRWLANRRQLMEKWVTAFGDRLRPRLVRQRYRTPHPRWWQAVKALPPGLFWGGEVAAAKLTGTLRPEAACVYATSDPKVLILEHDLRPDPYGNVEILDAFWGDWPHAVREDCVHPLVVYADLLASNIDRNVDTARRVYDQYLRQTADAR